jgi:hypothetical protein
MCVVGGKRKTKKEVKEDEKAFFISLAPYLTPVASAAPKVYHTASQCTAVYCRIFCFH